MKLSFLSTVPEVVGFPGFRLASSSGVQVFIIRTMFLYDCSPR